MRLNAETMSDAAPAAIGDSCGDDVGLRCRFSLMVRCEEPGCRRLHVISAGEDISPLQSRHFFCYMNKRGDSSKCCHVRKPGELGSARRRVDQRPSTTAGPKIAGKRVGSRDRDEWARTSDTSSVSSRSETASPSAPPTQDNDAFGGLDTVPYEIGSNIMVLHGKTVYPGKVVDRKTDSMTYLVKYDGLSASRSEWRAHAEVISIDEVISNRRSCRY
eukprot:m.439794 g.439794  ORF g.439794 m.439794 type:complete len:217 (+) comp18419_c0_seq1:178-828(+)